MWKQWRLGVVLAVAGLTVGLFASAPVQADRMSSSNFILNGNANSSFGGQGTSSSYGMFSTGGEPVIGKGTSGSFILGEGFAAQQEQSIQLTVQPGGLLGFWNFDEATGTAFVDSSATRADGAMRGTHDSDLTHTTGKLGNGMTGSGANNDSSILIPAGSIQPSSVTMMVWAKVDSFGVDGYWDSLCSYYASGAGSWGPFEIYTEGSNSGQGFHWTINNNVDREIDTTGSGVIPSGSWYHVVGTYNQATGLSQLYVNGVLKASQTFPAGPLNYAVANADNNISCFNNPRWAGEGIQGSLDHLKIFNRALTADEVKAEYDAQNAGVPTGISLGSVTPGASNTALQDVIVRTDSGAYGIVLSQDHNLQKGAQTIPAISASIASPAAWSEGTTKGLGFTLMNAPSLDGKWGTGANYAAIPGSPTSFYTRSSHASSDTIDVINSRLRLDTTTSQEAGFYSNTVTYTGTTIP